MSGTEPPPTVPHLDCPECGAPMALKETPKYRHKDGTPKKFWGCTAWATTGCRGGHGAHPDGTPLGIPANAATKAARMKVHAAFDRLWKDGDMSKGAAYRWLQQAMGMTEREAHIAKFDMQQCAQALRALEHVTLDKA